MHQEESDKINRNQVLHQEKSDNLPAALPMEDKAAGDSCNEMPEESTNKSSSSCLGRCLNSLRLEISSIVIMFSWVMIQVSSTSMILDKVCLVHYNYSSEICGNLDNYTNVKSKIEKVATNYQLVHTLLQTGPAVLISCFAGPWSDRYGRKIPVLIAIIGMTLDTLGSTVCAYFFDSRVDYYLIPAVFTGCCGGVVTVLAIIYSYASDVTEERLRTLKYAYVAMAVGLSQPLGAAAGGWIYKFLGYPAVFMISAGGLTLSFLLVAFFLPETRGKENNDPLKTKLKNLFTLKTLKEGFAATVQWRPNQGRKQILLLILSMCFLAIATNSTGDVSYYFVHHQYGWGNTKYSTFMAIYSVISIVLLIFIVPTLKYFRAGDPTLGLIGTVSLLSKYIAIGLAWKPAVYHIANILGCLSTVASLAGRSRISKVVSDEDIGKVFSFVATAEALLPVLTTVLISQVFTAFIDIYAAMPFLILALCLPPPLAVFAWMTRLPNARSEYVNPDEEKNEA